MEDINKLLKDARDWDESQHPRDDDGKFGSGGGGGGGKDGDKPKDGEGKNDKHKGRIEKPSNVDAGAEVSEYAAVRENAQVRGQARVQGNAQVRGNAVVKDNALIRDNAVVHGQAEVSGDAVVRDLGTVQSAAQVSGMSSVTDTARVGGSARVSGSTLVGEQSRVEGYAEVSDTTVTGASNVYGEAKISMSSVHDSSIATTSKKTLIEGSEVHNSEMVVGRAELKGSTISKSKFFGQSTSIKATNSKLRNCESTRPNVHIEANGAVVNGAKFTTIGRYVFPKGTRFGPGDDVMKYWVGMKGTKGITMDKDGIAYRGYAWEPRSIGEEQDRTIRFTGTDESADRYNTVIRADGWQLENFQRNPVFLWAHQSDQPPIGRVVRVEKAGTGKRDGKGREQKRLVFDVQFAKREDYPFADVVYKLYRAGMMRAVSVGFVSLEQRAVTDEAEIQELGLKGPGTELTKNELYELSAVPVPGNANALAEDKELEAVAPGVRTMFKAGAPGEQEFTAALESLRASLPAPAKPVAEVTLTSATYSWEEAEAEAEKRSLEDEVAGNSGFKGFPEGLLRSIVKEVVRAAELRLLPCLAGLAKQTEMISLEAKVEDLRMAVEATRGTAVVKTKSGTEGAGHVAEILGDHEPKLKQILEKLEAGRKKQ